MRKTNIVLTALLGVSGLMIEAAPALAQQQVNPTDLGIVVAPTAGKQEIGPCQRF